MSTSSLPLRRLAWLPVALLAAACQRGPSPETQAKIEELTVAAQERDRLLQDMAENSRLLSEISGELAKVRVPRGSLRVSAESPLRASRDTMVQKIRYIAARVVETETRLKESRRRIDELTNVSDSLRRTLEQTAANFEGIVATQLATIETMQGQIQALSDTLTQVAARANTVYYVIGTEDELLEKGYLVKEGGSRFLFVLWKQGRTLQPARTLDPADFHAIDRRQVTSIPLPDPTAEYRIASRQNLSQLSAPPAHDNVVRGTAALEIRDSERFWGPSRFLIIVRKGGREASTAS
jgi:hypothetical protein